MNHREELLNAFHIGEEDLIANRAGVLSAGQMRRLTRSGYLNLLGATVLALTIGAILQWVAPKPLTVIQIVLAACVAIAALTLGVVLFLRTRTAVADGCVECITGPAQVSMRGKAGWYLSVSSRSFKLPAHFWHVHNGTAYRVYFVPGIARIISMEPDIHREAPLSAPVSAADGRLMAGPRIASIPGAGEEYGISDDFSRVQELLRKRVKDYNGRVDREMLNVLTRFGTLHWSIHKAGSSSTAALAVVTVALDAFVVACRLAAFDYALGKVNSYSPQLQDGPAVFTRLSASHEAETRELQKALQVLKHTLLQEAEHQEWSDARNNAIQWRAAATYVVRAYEHLKIGFRLDLK